MPVPNFPSQLLVIEDEAHIRQNIQEILELSGYRVLVAADGQAGIELAHREQPDLIVCDILMPGLDGFQVLMALRQSDATATIPFIFLTAMAERHDWRQGMSLGADDYITKPFTPEELLGAVAARFERQAAYQSEREAAQRAAREILAELQAQAEDSAQRDQLAAIQSNLTEQLLRNLIDPLSNINLALRMLENAVSLAQRDRYLAVIRQECQREMQLLNEFSDLQALLTPNNAALLQRFNLLEKPPSG